MPVELGSFSLGAIAGGIVIGIANHFLSKSRTREDRTIVEFNKTASAFRKAFRQEIAFFRYNTGIKGAQSTDGSIAQFLRTGMVHRHTEALIAFRKHLSPLQRNSIDKAWKEYQAQIDGYNSATMSKKDKEAALEIIEAFLDEHAKLK